MIRKIKTFFGEVRAELARATWPWDPKEKGLKKYRELIDSTGIVLIAMLIMGSFVALNDFFLINAVSAFTRTDLSARRIVEVQTPGSASLPPEASFASQPEGDPAGPAPIPPDAPQAEPSNTHAGEVMETPEPHLKETPAPDGANPSLSVDQKEEAR
ncbi:MAG: preprotein translocase subunit SecE [Verrucomicrobiia bacterium]